jgi:hypothetical protein
MQSMTPLKFSSNSYFLPHLSIFSNDRRNIATVLNLRVIDTFPSGSLSKINFLRKQVTRSGRLAWNNNPSYYFFSAAIRIHRETK